MLCTIKSDIIHINKVLNDVYVPFICSKLRVQLGNMETYHLDEKKVSFGRFCIDNNIFEKKKKHVT